MRNQFITSPELNENFVNGIIIPEYLTKKLANKMTKNPGVRYYILDITVILTLSRL